MNFYQATYRKKPEYRNRTGKVIIVSDTLESAYETAKKIYGDRLVALSYPVDKNFLSEEKNHDE